MSKHYSIATAIRMSTLVSLLIIVYKNNLILVILYNIHYSICFPQAVYFRCNTKTYVLVSTLATPTCILSYLASKHSPSLTVDNNKYRDNTSMKYVM